MSTRKTVWTLADAYVNIYLETASGTVTGVGTPKTPQEIAANPTEPYNFHPIFRHCFLESANVTAETPIVRRAVSGRGRRKITAPAGAYDNVNCAMENLLLSKDDEYNTTQIFNPRQHLRIHFMFYKMEYTDVGELTNDPFYLTLAKATNFKITGRMPEVITANASFEAEQLV